MTDPERVRFQKVLFDGRNHELASETTPLLQQKEGLSRLYSFLWRESDSGVLSPFVLNISSKTAVLGDRVNPTCSFYLGGNNKYLNLTMPTETASVAEVIWAIPRVLNRGLKPYHWFEFYNSNDPNVEEQAPFSACRLQPEERTNKIDFRNWHGIEEELLIDYILGDNNVSFSDLYPALIENSFPTSLASYRLGGRPGLSICLNENSRVSLGDRLYLIPKQDEQEIYQWIDIIREGEGSPVSSYQIQRDKGIIATQGWFGYEKQLLVDYLTNQRGICFENLRPLRACMPAKMDCISIIHTRHTSGINLDIYPPAGSLTQGEEVVILPKQDDQRFYQWLEVYKTDPETHNPVGNCIAAVRLLKGNQQKDWQGPQLQLLRDYAKGEKDFSNLRPINFLIGKGKDLIHLWRVGGRRIYLVLSKDFKLREGDNLLLIPEERTEEGTTFVLQRENVALAKYLYDPKLGKFTLTCNFAANGEIVMSYQKDSNSYVDLQGLHWITKSEVVKRYQMSFESVNDLLDGVSTVRFKDNTKPLIVYNDAEIQTRVTKDKINNLTGWKQTLSELNSSIVWVLEDSDGRWVSKSSAHDLLKHTGKETVEAYLLQVRSKSVRSSGGKRILAYNLDDIQTLPQVQEQLSRPKVDESTDILQDEIGRWTHLGKVADLYHLPMSTFRLQKFLEKAKTRQGVTRKRNVLLYNLDELEQLPGFHEYVQRNNQRQAKKGELKEKIHWSNMSEGERNSLIEDKARECLQKFGRLDQRDLSKNKCVWLAYAISKFYPGSYRGLREKLGIAKSHVKGVDVPSEDAGKLLQEYKDLLLSGQIMSYEEFMEMKEKQI